MIRSKVPTTKQEFGDNYIAVGPLNEAFIRTEVEVREPDIGALRRTIQEMRNKGVNVINKDFVIDSYIMSLIPPFCQRLFTATGSLRDIHKWFCLI